MREEVSVRVKPVSPPPPAGRTSSSFFYSQLTSRTMWMLPGKLTSVPSGSHTDDWSWGCCRAGPVDKLQRRYRLWSMSGQGRQWPLPGRGTLRSLVWLSFSYEMMTEGRGEGHLFIITCSLSLHVHTEHPLCCSRLRGLTETHKRQREPSPPRVYVRRER